MPKTTGNVKMTRITIRLPDDALREIEEYAREAGMYAPHFFEGALIAGSRHLHQLFTTKLRLDNIELDVSPTPAELARNAKEAARAARTTHIQSLPPKERRAAAVASGMRVPGGIYRDGILVGMMENKDEGTDLYTGNEGE